MKPRGFPQPTAARERTVVLTTSYPSDDDDPSGHFIATEVSELRAQGHDVLVLAPRPAERRPAPSENVRWLPGGSAFGWPGALARVREQPGRAAGLVRFILAARRELRSLGTVERLVAHFILPSVWPILDGRLARARSLEAVAHGSDVRLLARLPAPFRRRIARTLGAFDVRCASEELRETLGRALGSAFLARVRVAPSALDLPQCLSKSAARRELGIARAERLLVVVARLVPGKRVDVALRAARLVPGASVVVVGDGPERAALERDFPEARFAGLVGRRRALSWIAAADALLSASREEGAPSVVREARLLGTPVVALAAGDLFARSRLDPGLWVV